MFYKMLTTSTAKSLSQNYALATVWTRVAQSIHLWSVTKYFHTADFMENVLILPESRYFQRLTNCFESVCDVNSECGHIQVNSAEFVVYLPHTFIIQISIFLTGLTDAVADALLGILKSFFSSTNTAKHSRLHG